MVNDFESIMSLLTLKNPVTQQAQVVLSFLAKNTKKTSRLPSHKNVTTLLQSDESRLHLFV
jgi:hypothetical protein